MACWASFEVCEVFLSKMNEKNIFYNHQFCLDLDSFASSVTAQASTFTIALS